MEPVRESLVIAGHDLQHSVRSTKAIVFLFIYALLSVVAGAGVVWAVAKVNTGINDQFGGLAQQMTLQDFEEQKQKAYLELVTWFVGDEEHAVYLTSIPIIILFFFWATKNFLPWLIALMCFDQISGELHNRSIRYTLLRSRRGSLLGGKILANMTLVVALTVVTNLVLVVFALIKIPDFDLGAAALHLLRFWLLILPLGLAYVSLMAFFSASFRFPYYGLLAGVAFLLVTGVLGWIAAGWEKAAFLKWIVPWHYSQYLLSHRGSDQLIGAVAYLGIAAVFTALAWAALRWRDV